MFTAIRYLFFIIGFLPETVVCDTHVEFLSFQAVTLCLASAVHVGRLILNFSIHLYFTTGFFVGRGVTLNY